MTVEDQQGSIRKISLVRIAHVYYKHKDMGKAKEFMADFGFYETAQAGKRIYYRGYGTEPFVICLEGAEKNEFGGAAFVVESEEDLINASKILPPETKPTEVYDLKDAPGGGKCVTFYDPVDAFPFHLVYGQTPVEPMDPKFPEVKINFVSGSRCASGWLGWQWPDIDSLNSPRKRTAPRTRSSGLRKDRRRFTSLATLACV